LTAIVALALVVRVGAVAVDGPSYVPQNDAQDYDRHARSLAADQGYPPPGPIIAPGGPSAFRPPGYPLFLTGVYLLTDDSKQAGRYANAVLGAVCVLLLYLVAARIFSRRVGLWAAGLAAVYPPLAFLSLELYSEPLFIDLVLGAILAALAYRRDPRTRWAVLTGVLGGLATLTRANAVLILPVLALALWFRPRRSLESLGPPLAVLAAAAAIIAPWAARNYFVFAEWAPLSTSSGFGMAGVYNDEARQDQRFHALWRAPIIVPAYEDLYAIPELREVDIDGELGSRARSYALDHPGYVGEVFLWSTLRLFNFAESGTATPEGIYRGRGLGVEVTPAEPIGFFVVLPFALAGIVALVRRPRGERGPPWFWLLPVALVLPALVVLGLPRYRAPAEPWLLILAATGAIWALDSARSALGRRSLGAGDEAQAPARAQALLQGPPGR
jgi:4-amino-4-deoxy-L-arabinose transferase-like glycosyltransferase